MLFFLVAVMHHQCFRGFKFRSFLTHISVILCSFLILTSCSFTEPVLVELPLSIPPVVKIPLYVHRVNLSISSNRDTKEEFVKLIARNFKDVLKQLYPGVIFCEEGKTADSLAKIEVKDASIVQKEELTSIHRFRGNMASEPYDVLVRRNHAYATLSIAVLLSDIETDIILFSQEKNFSISLDEFPKESFWSILASAWKEWLATILLPKTELCKVYLEGGTIFERGISELKKGEWTSAIQIFSVICESKEKEIAAGAYYNLGIIYELKGHKQDAAQYYKSALRLLQKPIYREAMERINKN